MNNNKSGLAKRVAGNLDDILNSKPIEEIEEIEESESEVEKVKKSAKIETVAETIQKRAKTPKGKRIPVTTYINTSDYDRFEEVSHDLQKAVRRETEIKLKEANIVEISVLWMMDEFEKNPSKIIEKFVKFARK